MQEPSHKPYIFSSSSVSFALWGHALGAISTLRTCTWCYFNLEDMRLEQMDMHVVLLQLWGHASSAASTLRTCKNSLLNFQTCVFSNIVVKDMRKREYEIFTCVWRKTLSLDMHTCSWTCVIYPKKMACTEKRQFFRCKQKNAREPIGATRSLSWTQTFLYRFSHV